MSWSFNVEGRDKVKLKAESRRRLMSWHKREEPIHATMVGVADAVDNAIELFQLPAGRTMCVKANGHIDNTGHGNYVLEIKTEQADIVS